MLHKLYVRIWLAVVLTVVVLTVLVGWVWRMTSEPPLREVVVRNEFGEVIGNGRARLSRPPPVPGLSLGDHPPPPDTKDDASDDRDSERPGRFGRGPEFLVRMADGQTIHLHLPRPPNNNFKAPFGFAWTLALVAVAVILLGAGIGVLGSTINAFSTVIASDAAGISFADGLWLRLVILALTWAAAVAWVMRYAARVKADPSRSLVHDLKAANEAHFGAGVSVEAFTGLHQIVLILFAATFAVMFWGVSVGGWWMARRA